MTGTLSPAQRAQAIYQLPTSAFDEPALVNPGQEPGEGLAPDDPGALPRKGTPRLMASLKELADARDMYALAEQMYDGEVGDLPVSPHVQRLLAKANVNSICDLNYAQVPVNTIAEKLAIRAVNVVPEDQSDTEPEDEAAAEAQAEAQRRVVDAAQAVLDQVRKHNQLDIEEVELMLRTCKYGDAYLEVWPSRDAPVDPESDDTFDGTEQLEAGDTDADQVDIYVVSPTTVRVFYDQEQPLRVSHAIKCWEWMNPEVSDAKTQVRANIYLAGGVERWVCKPGGTVDRPEDWQPMLEDDQPWPMPYPGGMERIPFFHLRNGRPYGEPEHKSAYGPQQLINKLVSFHAVVIDFEGFPQRYLLLDPNNDNGLLNLIDPDNPEDAEDDPEGDGHSQLRSDPQAVWKLYANGTGQYDPADPDTFLKPMDRYIRAISELTGIPLDRFVGYTTPPSGQSRRIGNEVLYEKANARRRRHGAVLADAYEFALQLLGVTGVKVTVKWAPLDVAAGSDDWAVVSSKIASGVPTQVALVEAGYDDTEVEQWLLTQGGADLVRRVALLNSIGTAVQALAAGVGVGLVSREQAGDLVARVMGQIKEDLPALDKPLTIEMPTPQGPPGGGPPPPGGPAGQPGGAGQSKGTGQAPPPMPPLPPPPPPITVGVD